MAIKVAAVAVGGVEVKAMMVAVVGVIVVPSSRRQFLRDPLSTTAVLSRHQF